MSVETQLTGRHVLVLGGTSGIGFAVARRARDAGAKVTVASRDPKRVAGQPRADIRVEQVDVTDTAALEALSARIGPLDHLVVSLGAGKLGTVRDVPVAEARPSMDTKFWATTPRFTPPRA